MTTSAFTGSAKPRTRARAALAAASRLTDRDREVLVLLARHQVLTTFQITKVFFDSPRIARERVKALRDVGLIDTFQPPLLRGTSPQHCVLTPLGVTAVEGLVEPVHVAPQRKDAAEHLALRPDLKHLVGVNDVFCSLAAAARTTAANELELWWSERACVRTWGTYVRPDGFGRWRENERRADFFLEYDTGTEPLTRVLAKLPGYEAVAAATGIRTPVLFWLHSSAREKALHQRLAAAVSPTPVVTASGDVSSADPSGPLWWKAGRDAGRLRLIDLALT